MPSLTIQSAIERLEQAAVKYKTEDVRTPKVREAMHLILALFPQTRLELILIWRGFSGEDYITVERGSIGNHPMPNLRSIEKTIGVYGRHGPHHSLEERARIDAILAMTMGDVGQGD